MFCQKYLWPTSWLPIARNLLKKSNFLPHVLSQKIEISALLNYGRKEIESAWKIGEKWQKNTTFRPMFCLDFRK